MIPVHRLKGRSISLIKRNFISGALLWRAILPLAGVVAEIRLGALSRAPAAAILIVVYRWTSLVEIRMTHLKLSGRAHGSFSKGSRLMTMRDGCLPTLHSASDVRFAGPLMTHPSGAELDGQSPVVDGDPVGRLLGLHCVLHTNELQTTRNLKPIIRRLAQTPTLINA